MFIGSNNSLTYLKPQNKWFKNVFHFGRCQNIDYEDQYTYYGVRLFDFRLFVDKNNHIIVKNGSYEYSIFSFYEILDYLNKKGDVIVLVTLESPHIYYTKEMIKAIENKFKETCRIIETIYEGIMFCGGTREDNKLYSFDWEEKHGMPTIINPHDWSRLYRLITKWCPMFIGKLNKQYIERYENEYVYLMLNYVNRRK